ncbi:MAG: HAMP domain-containing histidine kinase [Candidatus Sericytochromatia bacterium]|nr:HAMP domain-containing histidine kinase [Candidatus Sericytochromatia bacterium]
MKNKNNALPLTITLGSILLFFCVVLTILWNYVLISNYSKIKQYSNSASEGYIHWSILGLGSFFFVIIIVGVVLSIVFLARQIILNQLQKNFIDSVTHELKTPLTSIKLYIETLKKHDLSKEQKDSFLNIMLKDVERLDNLMNHILDATQLENITKNYNFKDIELEEIINDSVDVIKARYNLKSENFNIKVKQNNLKSDPTALQLVLINLIDNAVKYSDDKILINLETKKDDNGKIIISVQDQGIGIPLNEKNKVFGRFYRISNKHVISQKGSGLGLFIVRENIKNMKGKIEIFSEGKDRGSTFTITLPE